VTVAILRVMIKDTLFEQIYSLREINGWIGNLYE